MIVGVFGPRDYKGATYASYTRVSEVLDTFAMTGLVSGGGMGVERLGLRYAEERYKNQWEARVVPPHIQALGAKVAFEKRNEEIIRQIDIGVVLWDGRERHYAELIAKIIQAGKTAYVTGLE